MSKSSNVEGARYREGSYLTTMYGAVCAGDQPMTSKTKDGRYILLRDVGPGVRAGVAT